MKENSNSFIIQCRTNYFLGIRPAHQQSKDTDGYKALAAIAKSYFDAGKYNEFLGFFMEGQYLIPLWAAHLMLEYGQPNENIKEECLKVIQSFTNNPLAPEVATEEKAWLKNYYQA